MKTEVQQLVSDLEDRVVFIGLSVSTLNDVKVLFGQLSDSMESSKNRGDQLSSFEEHFREVRVLSELMRFTIEELNGEMSNIEKIKDTLFEQVVKNPTSNQLVNKENPIAANNEDFGTNI